MNPHSKSMFPIFTLFTLLASLLGSAGIVTPVRAAALVVTKAADTNDGTCDGDCSLREAILLANANGVSSETITFAGNYTITLGSQLPDVTTAIVINGNGPTKTIIQASTCNPITLPGGCTPATYRVFYVGGNNANLTLDNLTVQHGKSTPSEGGGIYNNGALTVTNSVFSANSAYRGGGIFNTADLFQTVTVTNSTFSNNSAYGGGGGIYNEGTLIVTQGIFSDNASNYGGGIQNSNGALTVTKSIFGTNSALYTGGGILNSNGSLTVTNAAFGSNSAGDQGGGIFNYNASSTVAITNSDFSNNSADNGGGIYNNSGTNTLNITNTNFWINNSSSGSGGGTYNNDGGVTVTNSTFSGNSASVVGGGGFNHGTLTVTNSTFSGNSAAFAGSGIYNDAGLYLKNTILANGIGAGGDCYNVGGNSIAANISSLIEINGPNGNQCGTPAVTADPGLSPLGNYGGPTNTFAIANTSSAYNAGDNAICAASPVSGLDQRGVTRPQNSACDIGAYELDSTAPTVSSSLRVNATPTNLASVDFTVTFSETVTGVDISDFSLTTTGASSAAVSGVSGSGNTYTVTVNTGTGNGTIRLNVLDDDTILDVALNPLGAGFTNGEIYSVIKSATFADVPLSYWASSYIERLFIAGITGGCTTSPLNYCPTSPVTRAQMAIFLLKSKAFPASYTPPAVGASTGFSDVPIDYWAAAWVKQLAADGITSGCGPGIYCPDSTVTRAQMAVFLLKAKYGSAFAPSAPTGVFTDVPTSHWAAAWIERLASEGITSGCASSLYCPETAVTRDQMAVFLVKAFNLP